jgi:hypothetical protein
VGSDGVVLLEAPESASATAGTAVTVPINLRNRGALVEKVTLSVQCAQAEDWFVVDPDVVYMYPGGSATTFVRVSVPPDADPAEALPFVVTGVALSSGDRSVVESRVTIVKPWVPVPNSAGRRGRIGRLVGWVRRLGRRPTWIPPPIPAAERSFVLLSDHPVGPGEDRLGFLSMADALGRVVLAEHTTTPFTVGIQGGWGSGKSSLMRLVGAAVEASADRTVEGTGQRIIARTVWYNAWTSEGASALSGLIRSVLLELDPSVLRRLVRRGRSSPWAHLAVAAAGSMFGVGHLVDVVWRQFGTDKDTRNEIRQQLSAAMDEWVERGQRAGQLRRLVVFIDDLDRCSPDNIREVFEAIRVYLDAPGFIFVIGYDSAVVHDVLLTRGEGATTYRSYLEKIIQVDFVLPTPDADQARRLARACVRQSGASDLLGEDEVTLMIERSGRNPRRLKRFLNAFVLARQLDTATATLTPAEHLRVLLLQAYFPEFYALLLEEAEPDPLADVLLLHRVRSMARTAAVTTDGSGADGEVMTALATLCARVDVNPPLPGERLDDVLTRLESALPAPIPALAADRQFLSVVRALVPLPSSTASTGNERTHLLARLRERRIDVTVLPSTALVRRCPACGTDNDVTQLTCRQCFGLLLFVPGPAPLLTMPMPNPSTRLAGHTAIVYDRTGTGAMAAKALQIEQATVVVADTLRSLQHAAESTRSATILILVGLRDDTAATLRTAMETVNTIVGSVPALLYGAEHHRGGQLTAGLEGFDIREAGFTPESLVNAVATVPLRISAPAPPTPRRTAELD